MPNNREGPQTRESSKCLNSQSHRERLDKEAFWSPATRGLKIDWQGHNSWGGDSPCPCTLGASRVPASPAAVPSSRSALTGAELPQAKKNKQTKTCICACRVASVGPTLYGPVDCGLPDFSARQEYWSVLANMGYHTLMEHFISCCPSHQLPWVPGAARPLRPKQLHRLHTWASQGQTQVLQGSLRSKPQWVTHV